MADVQREFTSYKVYYFSGGSTADRPAAAEIDCFDATSTRVGSIFFYSYDAPLPLAENTMSGIYLHFPVSRFADVMTVLKEEKPLYLNFHGTLKWGYLATAIEPVGEQEGN